MRPISDRKPPNAAETPGARPKSAVLRNHEARSGPRSLAFRAATTQGRPSAAGIWEMSAKPKGEDDEIAPTCRATILRWESANGGRNRPRLIGL